MLVFFSFILESESETESAAETEDEDMQSFSEEDNDKTEQKDDSKNSCTEQKYAYTNIVPKRYYFRHDLLYIYKLYSFVLEGLLITTMNHSL